MVCNDHKQPISVLGTQIFNWGSVFLRQKVFFCQILSLSAGFAAADIGQSPNDP